MDDPNNTNQPMDTNVAAGTPDLPIEDITPTDTAPAGSVPTPLEPVAAWTAQEPVEPKIETLAPPSVPETEAAPMQENTIAPWPTPEPTLTPIDVSTLIASSPTADSASPAPVSTPTATEPMTAPTPTEVPMPRGKKKSKILPVIGGIVAILLVVGVAGAAYYVSNQLSNKSGIALNAPESKPLAASCNDSPAPAGCVNCNCGCKWIRAGSPGSTAPSCNSVCAGQCPSDGGGGGGSATCDSTSGACSGKSAGANICFGGLNLICNMVSGTTHCTAPEGGNGCGGGGGSCTKDGTFKWGTYPDNLKSCDYKNSVNSGCGSSCGSFTYACGIYCFGSCGADACGKSITYPDCDASKRDALASPQTITFTKAGTVDLYSRGAAGTVTLTSGSKTATFTTTQGDATKATASTPFVVAAGETYTIVVHESDPLEKGKASYGWILPQGNSCGPVKTPGVAIDSNSKPTGKCGELVDSSGVINAANSALDETGVSAPVQCWGDAIQNDDTQDYDYNDFTLAFGYEKSTTVGACMLINIYKKVNGAYGTTPLTTAQLQTLTVGDVLQFGISSNVDNLQGRFRVTVGGTAGSWLSGTVDNTKRNIWYSDYTVATAGNYTFEGQVSVTP